MSRVEVEPPRGAREALTAWALRIGLKLAIKPALSPALAVAHQRRWLEKLARLSGPGVTAATGSVGGIAGEWLRPASPAETVPGAILYLHGGGYCTGSPATHRGVTYNLARAAAVGLFAADYRLAPEHPFPAAVEDAVAAARALAAAGPLVIAGDSAGGGLALAAALRLRQQGIAAPTALVLFSPWVELRPATPRAAAPGEAMLSERWLDECARLYLAGADGRAAAPLHADLVGLPPTLIQAGADEVLRPDAERLHDALERAGVAVRFEIVARRWHVFQLHAGMLPSADAAVARAAAFISRAIRTPGRPD
jgi:acetyl esterase/lipase